MGKEPHCRVRHEHAYAVLGIEDNGEKVSRCGNCMTLKYEKDGRVRYDRPETKRKSRLRRPGPEVRRKRAEIRGRFR